MVIKQKFFYFRLVPLEENQVEYRSRALAKYVPKWTARYRILLQEEEKRLEKNGYKIYPNLRTEKWKNVGLQASYFTKSAHLRKLL